MRIELNDQPVEGGLSEEAFWVLIAQLDWSKEGQDEAVIEPVVVLLAASPLRPLYDFKDILSRKLYLLDTEAHAQHLGESAYGAEADHFSPDGFLPDKNRDMAARDKYHYQFREALEKDGWTVTYDLYFLETE